MKLLIKIVWRANDDFCIKQLIEQIILFLDDENGWEISEMVTFVFCIVICNVRQHHAILINQLIKRLDKSSNSNFFQVLRTINISFRCFAMKSVDAIGRNILLNYLKFGIKKQNVNNVNYIYLFIIKKMLIILCFEHCFVRFSLKWYLKNQNTVD